MEEEKQRVRSFDPFTLKGIWWLIKKRYPIVLAFLLLGGGVLFLVEDRGKAPQDDERRTFSLYLIGRFEKAPNVGELLLKRGRELVKDEKRGEYIEGVPKVFEKMERMKIHTASNGRCFSVFMRASNSFSKEEILKGLRELLAFSAQDGRRGKTITPSFGVLYSSGLRRREVQHETVDPLLRVRAYSVILIMSLLLGLFVASVVERNWSTR